MGNVLGLRGILLTLWLILFVLSILLIVSGIKAKNKRIKMVLILLGILLAIISIYLLIYTFLFGFNA